MVEAEVSIPEFAPNSALVTGIHGLSTDQKSKSAVFLYGASSDTDVKGQVKAAKEAGVGAFFLDYGQCPAGEGKLTACYKNFSAAKLNALAAAVEGLGSKIPKNGTV